MEENKSKKKQVNKKVLIPIIGIIIAIALVGVSYAVWHYTFNGTLKNTISTPEISLDLLESNENIINIENALPMGCTEGKAQTETFDFAVTSKTKQDIDVGYTISIQKLEVDNGYTALDDNQIAVYLTDYSGENELLPSNYSSNTSCSTSTKKYCFISKRPGQEVCYDTSEECQNNSNSCDETTVPSPIKGVSLVSQLNNYKLYTGTHSHDSTHEAVQDKFKLRAWIAGDVDTSSWNASTKLQYKFKIGVTSEEKQKRTYPEVVYRYGTNSVSIGTSLSPVTETKWIIKLNGEENEELASYVYDTHEECTAFLTQNGITEGQERSGQTFTCAEKKGTFGGFDYTEDYTTLNKNFFLKHNISSNGTVESSEVCYILNNTLYCLEGGGATFNSETHDYNNDSIYYEENTNTLKASFGESNCSFYSFDVSCSDSASGLSASARQKGGVYVGVNSSDCHEDDYGNSNCNE